MPTPRIFYAVPGQPARLAFPATTQASGWDALEQQVIMHLLATPGSDRYSPAGGGLGAVLRAHIQGASFEATQADVVEAVTRTKEELLVSQAAATLDAEETLTDLLIERIERTDDRRLALYLTLVNGLGERRRRRL